MEALAPGLLSRVLDRLELESAPTADLDGLTDTYVAWCRHVSFDNVIKRVHIESGSTDPIPNGDPARFFELWLEHGTGGTCWPSSGGLGHLLHSLGFDARLGSCAMLDQIFGSVETHGTVLVRVDGIDYWVDSSMLTEHPLPVRPGQSTVYAHPVHPMEAEPVGDLWRIWFARSRTDPPVEGLMHCRLLHDDVTLDHYLARYEWSRQPGASIFNHALDAGRCGAGNEVGTKWGVHGPLLRRRAADGELSEAAIEPAARHALLLRYGYSEEIVDRLPPDRDPPPRPAP